MRTITIITGCYNEEGNVDELYERVRAVMSGIGTYSYEHIFIDNHSTDGTAATLRRIAAQDTNVKVIINARNFGSVRSPMHAVNLAVGDAVIGIVADLQDPPEMIADFVREWENGCSMVLGVKNTSEESSWMFSIRKAYYRLVQRISQVPTFENYTGFGLYDRRVIDIIKSYNDPYPYFRGMIAEIGLPYKLIEYHQPMRKRGISKMNFYALYDMAMLGITNMSKVPLRIATAVGFLSASVSMLIALAYFIYKLIFWNSFSVGIAPLVIGIFFFSSIQLIFLGVLGEYIGSIHTHVQGRPYVVELDRVNFEYEPGLPKSAPTTESSHDAAVAP